MVYFLEERVLTLYSTLYLHILQCSEGTGFIANIVTAVFTLSIDAMWRTDVKYRSSLMNE